MRHGSANKGAATSKRVGNDVLSWTGNPIVCPGGKMDLAMQLILTPMIWRLMECRKENLARPLTALRR